MQDRNKTVGLSLGLLAVLVFGGSLPATRLAVSELSPWFMTAARAAIGGLVGLTLLAIVRPPFPRRHLGRLVLIALCLVIGFPAALAFASVSVPASHGGVVLGLLPLATTIAAVFLAGERPSLAFWLLSLLGSALVVAFALREGNVEIATGDLWLGVAVVLTGIGYTLSGLMAREMPGWQVIAFAVAIALAPSLVATFILWPANAVEVHFGPWAGLAYGGVMSQFVGYALWNGALARGGVARVGQLQLLQPFVTFALAAIVLGEAITPEMIVFALAVAAVVALGRRAAIGQASRVRASSP